MTRAAPSGAAPYLGRGRICKARAAANWNLWKGAPTKSVRRRLIQRPRRFVVSRLRRNFRDRENLDFLPGERIRRGEDLGQSLLKAPFGHADVIRRDAGAAIPP